MAAGLPLWAFAVPMGKIANIAFLWAANLERVCGKLPAVDLRIPTCSASSTKLVGCPAILRVEIALAMKASSSVVLLE